MEAKELKLRLFLQGIEVPVISASIQISGGGPAQASIQIVPAASGIHLKPRTLVHLFSLDPMSRDISSDDLDRYKMIFGGEIVGVAWAKNRYSRSLVLQCLDWSSYWDAAYQYFMTLEDQLNGRYKFFGAGTGQFSDLFAGHLEVTSRLLSQDPKSPYLTQFAGLGLLSGMMRLIEAVGGIPGELRGCNDFFSIAEMMLHLTQQIGVSKYDDTNKLFNAKAFNAFINGGSGCSLGQMASVRDVLNMAMQYIFYECYPNPAPYYIPEIKYKETVDDSHLVGKLGEHTATTSRFVDKQVTTQETKTFDRVSERDDSGMRPGFVTHTPVSYTVDVTKTVREVETSVELITSDVKTAAGIIDNEIALLDSALGGRGALASGSVPSKYEEIQRADPESQRCIQYLSKASEFFAKTGLRPDALKAINATKIVLAPVSTMAQQIIGGAVATTVLNQKLRDLLGVFKKARGLLSRLISGEIAKGTKEVTKIEGGLLKMQLFRPDIYFAAPPKCNVLFPDLYTSFQYQRNFLAEITRFELTTSDAIFGADNLMGHRYYSPPNLFALMTADGQSYAGLAKLMSHEAFVGIIPRREQISNINFYYKGQNETVTTKKKVLKEKAFAGYTPNFQQVAEDPLARAIIDAELSRTSLATAGMEGDQSAAFAVQINTLAAREAKYGVEDVTTVVGVPYAQRVANHMFYKYRFAPRVGSVEGVYNPHLVAGFPALILDRGWAPESKSGAKCPPQFVGLLVGLSHTASQTGQGSSGLSLSHLRIHDGREDEFIGEPGVGEKQQIAKEKKTTVLNTEEIFQVGNVSAQEFIFRCYPGSTSPLKKGDKGPAGGKVLGFENSRATTNLASSAKLMTTALLPPKVIAQWMKDGTIPLSKTVSIEEEVSLPVGSEVPFEDTVKPAWMSDIFLSQNIGPKFYNEILGVDALTDDLVITDKAGNVVLTGGTLAESSLVKPSTKTAAEHLAQLYAQVELGGNDTVGFSSQYIRRPIATLRNLLGDQGAFYNDDGSEHPPNGKTKEQTEFGFHGLAIANLDHLKGLAGMTQKKLDTLGATKGTREAVSSTLDPRPERVAAVSAYITEVVTTRFVR
jgi:hypothetical protein